MTTQEQAEKLAAEAALLDGHGGLLARLNQLLTNYGNASFDCGAASEEMSLDRYSRIESWCSKARSAIPLVELFECVSELRRAGRGSYVDFDAIDKALAKLDDKLKGTK